MHALNKRGQGQPYIFEDVMATNDTFMQEYGLFQVSNAHHRAEVQLGSLDLVVPT